MVPFRFHSFYGFGGIFLSPRFTSRIARVYWFIARVYWFNGPVHCEVSDFASRLCYVRIGVVDIPTLLLYEAEEFL